MSEFSRFIKGFKNFRKEYFEDEESAFETLQHAQSPELMVVACSDSRADPALLINAEPGDVFVVRNVANLIPSRDNAAEADSVMAAVEYGVKHLKVKHIVVLGHSNCGGICGLMHPEKIAHDCHVLPWVRMASPAIDAVMADAEGLSDSEIRKRCEEASVLLSTDNLLSYDWIRSRIASKELHLHTWYFDLSKGDLLAYDADEESFIPLHHWDEGVLHKPEETASI